MFIMIAFDRVLNVLPMFLRMISTVLSQEISHGMRLHAWEFLLIKSASFRVLASSFRQLLLRLCSNRCAEALVVNMKFSIVSHM